MKLIPTLTFSLLLVSFLSQAQKVDLKKDQTLKVTTKSSNVVNQEVMGQSMEITNEGEDTKEFKVEESGADGYKISGKIIHMKANFAAMGKEGTFDSDKPDEGDAEMTDQFKKTMDMPINFTVDPSTGDVTMAEMSDEEKQTNGMMASFGNSSQMQYEMLFLPLESSKLKVGNSWKDSVDNDGIKVVTDYTVKEITGNDAVITRHSVITITKTVEAQQGMEVEINMTVNADGDGTYNKKTGVLKKATIKSEGEGSADAMGMNIPMSVKTTSDITVE